MSISQMIETLRHAQESIYTVMAALRGAHEEEGKGRIFEVRMLRTGEGETEIKDPASPKEGE